MFGRRALMGTALAVVFAVPVPLSAPAGAAEPAVYHLPAAPGTALAVRHGVGEGPGRTADEAFAYDFVASTGPPRFGVVAARGGTVMSARAGVAGGRCEAPIDGPPPDCWRNVNYILVDHGDGTSALYSHLQRGSFEVRIGDVVAAGQPLADAGRSGWTDHIGLRFAVQPTPTWDARGKGGWFQTASMPVAFADPDVVDRRADGVPLTDDLVVSGNSGPAFEPFTFGPRPRALPAAVPFEAGISRTVSAAYQAASPDGYGLHFAPGDVPVEVKPLFGGRLAFAGCAGGSSASLGRTVAVAFDVGDASYLAVHGHLSSIAPDLLALDPALPSPIVAPGDTIGSHGPDEGRDDGCAAAGADAGALYVGILRDATVTPEGQISGGTPVSPEPLVGERAYEGFRWWAGPAVAAAMLEQPGKPRVRWNETTPASGSHIGYGRPVTLKVRVRDVAAIDQVRFRAWYPRWPQLAPSRELVSFDPDRSWREIAVCDAPGGPTRGYGNLCQWDGDANDGKVTYVWDPTSARPQPSAPWLPPARAASVTGKRTCVPVSLAVEVIDRAGHVVSDITRLPLPAECDDAGAEAAIGSRVLYLDPLLPPRAPGARGTNDRGWPPVYEPDPLKGAIVWRDRSDNEDGFHIYARRKWFAPDCSVLKGQWQLVDSVRHDQTRYRPNHGRVRAALPVPDQSDVPGSMDAWEYAVAAYNAAGESRRVRVAGFLGGSEAHCDVGLVPPPGLEG